MGGQVVEDHVDLSIFIDFDHLIHERDEFFGAAARKALTNDVSGGGPVSVKATSTGAVAHY